MFRRRSFFIASALVVPCLTWIDPIFLTINGVGPCWAVLWLLPWSLENGPIQGAIAGFCLGLVLDGITIDFYTQIPILVIFGFWWGHLAKKGLIIERSFSLALLALIGTLCFGINLWVQQLIIDGGDTSPIFNLSAINTLLSQVIITGLIAPIFCSWLLILFRKNHV